MSARESCVTRPMTGDHARFRIAQAAKRAADVYAAMQSEPQQHRVEAKSDPSVRTKIYSVAAGEVVEESRVIQGPYFTRYRGDLPSSQDASVTRVSSRLGATPEDGFLDPQETTVWVRFESGSFSDSGKPIPTFISRRVVGKDMDFVRWRREVVELTLMQPVRGRPLHSRRGGALVAAVFGLF